MNDLVWILGGFSLAIVSAFVGHLMGGFKKVGEKRCTERREACMDNIANQVDSVKESINQLHKKIDRINDRQ
jgi:hypothetical protein